MNTQTQPTVTKAVVGEASLDYSISEVGLSPKPLKLLQSLDCQTLRDVTFFSEFELNGTCCWETLEEIRSVVRRYGGDFHPKRKVCPFNNVLVERAESVFFDLPDKVGKEANWIFRRWTRILLPYPTVYWRLERLLRDNNLPPETLDEIGLPRP